ncbi:MAG: ABC transporter permease [Candidatus Planktophila sp.]
MNKTDIYLVARREMSVRLKSKPVLFSSILFLCLAIMAPMFNSFQVSDRGIEKISAVVEGNNLRYKLITNGLLTPKAREIGFKISLSKRKIISADRKFLEKSQEVLIFARDSGFSVIASESLNPNGLNFIVATLREIRVNEYLSSLGLKYADYSSLVMPKIQILSSEIQKNKEDKKNTATLLIIFLYSLISISSGFLSMSIIEEKSSKVIEVILNSTSIKSLFYGKVLGVMTFALVQFSLTALAFYVSSYLNGSTLQISLSILESLVFFLWVLISLSTYAFVYGGISALVSRSEDMGAVQGPLGLILISSLYLSVYIINSSSTSISNWLIYVPLLNLLVIPAANVVGALTGVEVVASSVVVILILVTLMLLMTKLYETYILRKGTNNFFSTIFTIFRRAERSST